MPKAADDLPLPLPVWTMMRPFLSVLVAMILSRAAFFLAIFIAWRSRSGVASVIGLSFWGGASCVVLVSLCIRGYCGSEFPYEKA